MRHQQQQKKFFCFLDALVDKIRYIKILNQFLFTFYLHSNKTQRTGSFLCKVMSLSRPCRITVVFSSLE